MSKSKRQFYIRQGDYEGDTFQSDPFYSVVANSPEGIKDPIHVIEYSAFEELKNKIKELKNKIKVLEQKYGE